ncbi:MAG: hypothetical protein R3C28_09755 [Pirellulaceae bacterium]
MLSAAGKSLANLIIEKSPTIPWYTDLHPFFALIESTIRSHRWLWSDVDVNRALPLPDDTFDPYVVDGSTLFDFAAGRPQFNWSVLSALPFDADVDPTAIPREAVPYADGNPDFWHGSPRPRYTDALFEIVCWDSSATLLIGTDDQQVLDAFHAAYPGG